MLRGARNYCPSNNSSRIDERLEYLNGHHPPAPAAGSVRKNDRARVACAGLRSVVCLGDARDRKNARDLGFLGVVLHFRPVCTWNFVSVACAELIAVARPDAPTVVDGKTN